MHAQAARDEIVRMRKKVPPFIIHQAFSNANIELVNIQTPQDLIDCVENPWFECFRCFDTIHRPGRLQNCSFVCRCAHRRHAIKLLCETGTWCHHHNGYLMKCHVQIDCYLYYCIIVTRTGANVGTGIHFFICYTVIGITFVYVISFIVCKFIVVSSVRIMSIHKNQMKSSEKIVRAL